MTTGSIPPASSSGKGQNLAQYFVVLLLAELVLWTFAVTTKRNLLELKLQQLAQVDRCQAMPGLSDHADIDVEFP